MLKSKFFNLNTKDFINGLIVALLTALANTMILPGATFKAVLLASVSAMIAYLAKNLITNSDDKILTKEVKTENLANNVKRSTLINSEKLQPELFTCEHCGNKFEIKENEIFPTGKQTNNGKFYFPGKAVKCPECKKDCDLN